MYKDMYNVFDNADIQYHDCPENFEHFIHLRKSKVIKIKWFYGDTLSIKFNLREPLEQSGYFTNTYNSEEWPQYLDGKHLVFTFYNFRHEVIWEKLFVPNEINSETFTIELPITKEVSEKNFKKGIYSGSLKVESDDLTSTVTILDASNFIIYVE